MGECQSERPPRIEAQWLGGSEGTKPGGVDVGIEVKRHCELMRWLDMKQGILEPS